MIYSTCSPPIYTEEEFSRFYNLLTNPYHSFAYNNAIRFFIHTGLTYNELAALEWKSIDFNNRILHITKTMQYNTSKKTWITTPCTDSSTRNIHLSREAIKILLSQKHINASLKLIDNDFRDTVFLTKTGHPVSISAYNRLLNKICTMATLPPISVHMLRQLHSLADSFNEGCTTAHFLVHP